MSETDSEGGEGLRGRGQRKGGRKKKEKTFGGDGDERV